MTTKKFLNNAYELDSVEQTLAFYKKWADSYDEEITDNCYASPLRTAEALLACNPQLKSPVLDIGCGTGISGLFLQHAGFTELH